LRDRVSGDPGVVKTTWEKSRIGEKYPGVFHGKKKMCLGSEEVWTKTRAIWDRGCHPYGPTLLECIKRGGGGGWKESRDIKDNSC